MQGDVKFIGKIEGEYIKGAVVYDFPCLRGDGCIKEVKVDGKLVYSGEAMNSLMESRSSA